jgi:signal transduction histidine kinase
VSPLRRRAELPVTARLLAVLLLIFLVAATLAGLLARHALQAQRTQQLQDAQAYMATRIRTMDQGWRLAGYGFSQQVALWQAVDTGLAAEARLARLQALLLPLLDASDFSRLAIIGPDGRTLMRYATRGLDEPGAVAAAAGPLSDLGWAYSEADRVVYRVVSQPLRFDKQPCRLLLYAPLDPALLSRLLYPSTQLTLLHQGRTLTQAGSGDPASAAASSLQDQQAALTLAWDASPEAPQLRVERQFRAPLSLGQVASVVLGCSAVCVLLGWLVLGRWVRAQALRLGQLQDAALRFAQDPLNAPVPMLASDVTVENDISQLARSQQQMMSQVRASMQAQAVSAQALASLNATLEERVASRTQELAQARDEALEAVRAKERFLSTMSHEIRTPMNGLLGALELLSHTDKSPRQGELIDVAATSGEALLSIINDVLDYAKLRDQGVQLAREPLDVNAIARSVTTLFSASAERKGLALRLEADPRLAGWRLGDALRLRQVLMNLVGNAIKFTQRGEVVVRTFSRAETGHPDRVSFEVADTGMGIAPAQQARIFEAFAQAEVTTQRHLGGTGLGLAISRELVLAMGGLLQVDSATGAGARFHFEVALAPDTQARPVRPPRLPASPAAPLQGTVLLVEDNSVNRLIGSAMLEALGLQVCLAENGEEALAAWERQPLSLVLMDCQMPVLDGYEATHRLRELERQQQRHRTPVIALTANTLSGDVERCLAAGMDAHLGKPFSGEQLRAIIAPWLTPAADASA